MDSKSMNAQLVSLTLLAELLLKRSHSRLGENGVRAV
jgi:hypothetical protein